MKYIFLCYVLACTIVFLLWASGALACGDLAPLDTLINDIKAKGV